MSKQTYTNRHGQKVKVDDVIEVKAKAKSASSSEDSPQSVPIQAQAVSSLRLPKLAAHSRLALTAGAVVMALVILALAVVGWSEYRISGYERQKDADTSKIAKLAKSPLTRPEDYSTTIFSLSTVRECGSNIDGFLAAIYPRLKDVVDRCDNEKSVLQAIARSLTHAQEADNYLAKMQPIFVEVQKSQAAEPYAAAAPSAELWKKVHDNLVKLSPPSGLSNEHRRLVETAAKLSESWDALARADVSQDSATFTATEQALAVHYQELRDTADGIDESIVNLQASVSKAILSL